MSSPIPEVSCVIELRVQREPSVLRNDFIVYINYEIEGLGCTLRMAARPDDAVRVARESVKWALGKHAREVMGWQNVDVTLNVSVKVTDREWTPESRALVKKLKEEILKT